MFLLFIAFLSGVLTVLSPCVLSLLPIILGASIEDGKSKKIPLIVITSLSLSILVFSLLLKSSTLLIDVPPSFWKYVSGGLLIFLGVITIFPKIWGYISEKFWFSTASNKLLQNGNNAHGVLKYILLGAALGPVFSSCSPTYSLILAIILPAGFAFWILALILYILGLAAILFAIAFVWQKLIKNLRWASNPNGIFKKLLGVIFLAIGLAIISWVDKKIETKLLDLWILNTTQFEQSIIDTIDIDKFSDSKDSETSASKSAPTWGKCSNGSCEKEGLEGLDFLRPENILTPGELSEKWYFAPDFAGLENWINSDEIKSIEELRGQVLIVKFWTLGCVNCIKSHPDTNKLYSEFHDQGLEIIGIHAPEFQHERKLEQVQQAVEEYKLEFPVVQDNEFVTWKRYNNRYWPAMYIIDKDWKVRFAHFGEGGYEKQREVIKQLLTE